MSPLVQNKHYTQHGAQVYATAGADEKHEFLRSLGVKFITSSRNGAKFEQDMKTFLAEAGDDGIDVVLNSLSSLPRRSLQK